MEGRNRFLHHTCRLVGAFSPSFVGERIRIMFKTFLNLGRGSDLKLLLRPKIKKITRERKNLKLPQDPAALNFRFQLRVYKGGPKRLNPYVK